jgi:hypothetical protein
MGGVDVQPRRWCRERETSASTADHPPKRRGNQAGFCMVAGIDEIIATWNKPQNRKRLVSGQAFLQSLRSAAGKGALNLRREGLSRLGLVGQFCIDGDPTDTVRVRSKVVL